MIHQGFIIKFSGGNEDQKKKFIKRDSKVVLAYSKGKGISFTNCFIIY